MLPEQKLINYFLRLTELSSVEIDALKESMVIKHYPKGSYLVKEGEFSNTTYFVLEGCVRQFRMLDGEDVSTNFFSEEQWIISSDTGASETSTHSLICMEDCTLVLGDEKKAAEIFEKFPQLEKVARKIVESAFMEQQQTLSTYISDKPEQRYQRLLKQRPDLLQRVPQYDIASYIGVKPESLSRIRKKMHQKKD